jgi:hypothetical protein
MGINLDTDWAEISSLAGGLPDAARDEISEELRFWQEKYENSHFEIRSYKTEVNIGVASRLANDLSPLLDELAQAKDYPCFNTGGVPLNLVEFEHARETVSRLREMLALDRARFQRKSAREWHKKWNTHLVRRLLEIQAHHLEKPLPLQVKEKRNGVQYRGYLEKCTGFGRELDVLLKFVTRDFARRRKT